MLDESLRQHHRQVSLLREPWRPPESPVAGGVGGDTGGEVAVDLLTRTGPISGAVRPRKMERLQADAEAFTSLHAVTTRWQRSLYCPTAKVRAGKQEEEE